jgi:lysophospholipase L1-like esterase
VAALGGGAASRARVRESRDLRRAHRRDRGALGRGRRRADVLIVQGGINDIAQGRAVEDAARNLCALVDQGLALGLSVALCDVLPWNNGGPEHARAIVQLNALVAGIGVPVLPFHDTLEDPERPGRMKAEWTNEDGDHPSLEGYRRLGELAFRPL